MTITRTSEGFSVTTDTVLSDGTLRADDFMRLDGTSLRSVERPGHIRVGGLMRVELGPRSLSIIAALSIGESATFPMRSAHVDAV